MTKVALVTGAAGSIGGAIADRLARDGFVVIATDVNEAGARATAESIGERCHALRHDVTSREDWDAAAARARELGTLAVTVNNAGIVRDRSLRRMTDEEWDLVVDVHLRGAFLGCQTSLREMADHGAGGRIVNMSSTSYLGAFGQANYAAAKGGIVSLTKTVALEGARFGVLCNAVAPGNIDTPMFATVPKEIQEQFIEATALRRLGKPSEVAGLVHFLTSEDSSFVTGQVIHVDGLG